MWRLEETCAASSLVRNADGRRPLDIHADVDEQLDALWVSDQALCADVDAEISELGEKLAEGGLETVVVRGDNGVLFSRRTLRIRGRTVDIVWTATAPQTVVAVIISD